jgi:hypothetical protein
MNKFYHFFVFWAMKNRLGIFEKKGGPGGWAVFGQNCPGIFPCPKDQKMGKFGD